MIIQIALDRFKIDEAYTLARSIDDTVEIIEVGTSLIKDYGIIEIMNRFNNFKSKILLDLKTIDQGNYEFEQAFSNGVDIATVMAVSNIETIRCCQHVAKKYGKEYMIDLLSFDYNDLSILKEFDEAIFCIHKATDSLENSDIDQKIRRLKTVLPNSRIFVSGGITPEMLSKLDLKCIEGVIVGKYVTRSACPDASIREIMKVGK